MDPGLMVKAFHAYTAVCEGTLSMVNTIIGKRFKLSDDGTELEITDNPVSRMVEAVRTVFPDPVEGGRATLRLYQLFVCLAYHKDDLGPLVREIGGEMSIHSSLLQAVATASLGSNDTFDPGTLLIEATNYFIN